MCLAAGGADRFNREQRAPPVRYSIRPPSRPRRLLRRGEQRRNVVHHCPAPSRPDSKSLSALSLSSAVVAATVAATAAAPAADLRGFAMGREVVQLAVAPLLAAPATCLSINGHGWRSSGARVRSRTCCSAYGPPARAALAGKHAPPTCDGEPVLTIGTAAPSFSDERAARGVAFEASTAIAFRVGAVAVELDRGESLEAEQGEASVVVVQKTG